MSSEDRAAEARHREAARAIIGGCTMDFACYADCLEHEERQGGGAVCECCSLTEYVAAAIAKTATTSHANGFKAGVEAAIDDLEVMAKEYFRIAGGQRASGEWARHDETNAFGRSCKVAITSLRALLARPSIPECGTCGGSGEVYPGYGNTAVTKPEPCRDCQGGE